MTKIAVVLFNLGGPDKPQAIPGFLRNLFSDPAIIQAPSLIRFFLARLIVAKRLKKAQALYGLLGGKSPILENTIKQANSLENLLQQQKPGDDIKVFIAMRYWHPFSYETAKKVESFAPEKIVELPLYPQYSTTTTASSLRDWRKSTQKIINSHQIKTICCYPSLAGFVQAMAVSLRKLIQQIEQNFPKTGYKILFSAHGLPQKIIENGDPYDAHIKDTAQSIAIATNLDPDQWQITYQSRVGPLQWLKPYTEEVIDHLASEQKGIVIVPVSFVSEHSETLVELDIMYQERAKKAGAPFYYRLPTVSDNPVFIKGLAEMVIGILEQQESCSKYICPKTKKNCYHQTLGSMEKV